MAEWPGTWAKDVCVLSSCFVLHCACRPYLFRIANQIHKSELFHSICCTKALLVWAVFIGLGSGVFLSLLPTALAFIDSDAISDLLFPLRVNFIYVPNHSHFCQQLEMFGDIQVEVSLERKAMVQLEFYNIAWRTWWYLKLWVSKIVSCSLEW